MKTIKKFVGHEITLLLVVGFTVGIANSAVGLKICGSTAGIKKYKLIIKKKKKNHDKIVLLGKIKLNTINCLIFEA